MALFRVLPFEDIGVPAILVDADRGGLRMFESALRSAYESGAAAFEFNSIRHAIVCHEGAADIVIGLASVQWRFDAAKLIEVLDLIGPLFAGDRPGHQYVDVDSPVETLVLSLDEYPAGAPLGEFPELSPSQMPAPAARTPLEPLGATRQRQPLNVRVVD